MSKETNFDNSGKKGLEVSADALMSVVLERSISDKDQTIGAQKETIKITKEELAKTQKELAQAKLDLEAQTERVADDQMVIVVEKVQKKGKWTCPNCGYENKAGNNYCWDCDHNRPVEYTEKIVQRRNFDSVVEEIRNEESEKLKVDNVKLTKTLNNTEFELSKLTTELEKVEKNHDQELTDARRKVRDTYQKEVEDRDRKIEELVEEIHKLEENKTDAEVEEARKQEIVDLKTQIDELESIIEKAKEASTPRMKKFWQKIAVQSEQKQLEEEMERKKERVYQISNQYPYTEKTPWWKKGKYAKDTNPFSWFF